MKRLSLVGTLLFSSLALSAPAQTHPAAATPAATPAAPMAPAGPSKIAVIEFEAAVASTNEGQRNFADLKKKFEPKENQLKAQSDEVESLTKQLQAQGASLSDAARATQARTIDEKKKKLERDVEDLRAQGAQEANEMYNTLASKVYDVLSSYAQQQGYTIVLDRPQQQSPVLIAMPTMDISKPVVDAYNTKSGIPAPPPQPASAATPRPAAPKAPTAH
jgi:outer membrane protein